MKRTKRQQECEAFAAIVEVCKLHRDVWCTHELSNRAIARLYNSVEMLHRAIDNQEPDYPRPRRGSVHYRVPKKEVMFRLVDRASGIYTVLERRFYVSSQAELRTQLPARETMPTEEEALVIFCTTLLERLPDEVKGRTRRGSLGHSIRLLNAALDQYILCHLPPKPLIQTQQTVGTYRRCLNSCIRVLLEMVDPCIPRYVGHSTFVQAYHASRKVVIKLTVDARRTYFVERTGTASLRHKDALRWTPWNDKTAQENQQP